jgi:hypothetical protein
MGDLALYQGTTLVVPKVRKLAKTASFPHSHSFGDDLDFLFSPSSFNFNFDESVTYMPGTFCYPHPSPHNKAKAQRQRAFSGKIIRFRFQKM